MSLPIYIVDEMKAIVDAVNVAAPLGDTEIKYMYGHPLEIRNRLQIISESPERGAKFPLVVLLTDITITKNIPGLYGTADLRLLVMNITQPEYFSEKRTEVNFKAVLHPIKNELIKQIELHKQFTFPTEISYSETDAYFYGSSINNKNVFGDYIDCIEISNLSVNIKNKIC